MASVETPMEVGVVAGVLENFGWVVTKQEITDVKSILTIERPRNVPAIESEEPV